MRERREMEPAQCGAVFAERNRMTERRIAKLEVSADLRRIGEEKGGCDASGLVVLHLDHGGVVEEPEVRRGRAEDPGEIRVFEDADLLTVGLGLRVVHVDLEAQ